MKYIILTFTLPGSSGQLSYEASEAWRAIEKRLTASEKSNVHITRLGQHTWLIPYHNHLPTIGAALYWAESGGVAYKILTVESEGDWCCYHLSSITHP